MSKHLAFPDQRPDENLILLVRRHWTRLAKHILKLILGFILPIVLLLIFIFIVNYTFDPDSVIYMVVVLVASIYYLFVWLFFFNDFVDYHLDLWVVTDQRIINIEQEGLFNRVISSQSIERVQDVTSEVRGKTATFLNYGDVHVQTAGEEKRFEFEEVPNPAKIAKIIHDIHDRVEEREEQEDREALAKTLKEHDVKHYAIPPKNLSAEPATDKPISHTPNPPHSKTDKQDEDSIF